MLAALEFMALDICLAVFAFKRPWAALVVLLALLPFNGIITRVAPVMLLLPVPGQLALAGWHDAIVVGISAAAAWGLASRRYDARQLGLIGLAGAIVLILGVMYVVIAPRSLDALYSYRTLYEPIVLFLAVLVLSQGAIPGWVSRRAAVAIVGSAAVAALAAIPQVYLGGFAYIRRYYEGGGTIDSSFIAAGVRQPRGVGTLTSPNEFGAYLAMAATTVVNPGLSSVRTALRFAALAAIAVGGVLSFSRTGAIATVIGCGIVLALSFPTVREATIVGLRRVGRPVAVAAVVSVPALLLAILLVTPGAMTYLENTIRGVDPSVANRAPSVQIGLSALAAQPLGRGLGTAGPKGGRFEGTEDRVLTEVWYLVYAIQVGLPGLVAFTALVAGVAWRLWKRRGGSWARTAIGAGVGVGLAAIFIPVLDDPPIWTSLWVIAALGIVFGAPSQRPIVLGSSLSA